MKKFLLTSLIALLNVSCSAYKTSLADSSPQINQTAQINENIPDNSLEVEVTTIPEMGEIPNFSMFSKLEAYTISKEIIKTDIDKYRQKIKDINLVELSKWAKPQMSGYKIQDNAFETFSIENSYTNKSDSMYKIKLDSLPSHSPLVKRDLYMFNIYDQNNKLKAVYITIQGHLEE